VKSKREVSGWPLAAAACVVAFAFANEASAAWVKGEFTSAGKPVQEYHCTPASPAPSPVVMILHGASRRGTGYAEFEQICTDLAAQGYFAEFIEYYSQTPAVQGNQPAQMQKYFPVWLAEIRDGVAALRSNSDVDSTRVGLLGYSLGAFLALSSGALAPDKYAAIVEYYGGLPPPLREQVRKMPPVLILHGDADTIVPVAIARQLDDVLTSASRPHEMRLYPRAQHAFNFPGAIGWYNAADAADSWKLTLDFFAKYLKSTPPASTTPASGS
jgi:carboxymethylenebutenolidase